MSPVVAVTHVMSPYQSTISSCHSVVLSGADRTYDVIVSPQVERRYISTGLGSATGGPARIMIVAA